MAVMLIVQGFTDSPTQDLTRAKNQQGVKIEGRLQKCGYKKNITAKNYVPLRGVRHHTSPQ